MKRISRLASVLALGASFVAPLFVFAATPTGINDTYIKGYATSIENIINVYLVPVLIALAFITFLWGIYNYFIKCADDAKAQETGRTFMLYGIIGLVIIFSVWGIVSIFTTTLGLSASTAPAPPTIGGSATSPSNSAKGKPGDFCWIKSDCISNDCGSVDAFTCE